MQRLSDVHLLGTVVWHTTEAFLGNGTAGKGAACAREPQDGGFAGARYRGEWYLHSSTLLTSLPGSQEALSILGERDTFQHPKGQPVLSIRQEGFCLFVFRILRIAV